MDEKRKQQLLILVEDTLDYIIQDELFSRGFWDGMLENEDLTEEEFQNLREWVNIEYNIYG